MLWTKQGMTAKDCDSLESAVSLEDLEGPGLATPGMVWSFVLGLGLWGGVEPRSLLLSWSSLAPTHGPLLQEPDSSSLALGPQPSVLSQKLRRLRLESSLMLTLEESPASEPLSSLTPSQELLRQRLPSTLAPSQEPLRSSLPWSPESLVLGPWVSWTSTQASFLMAALESQGCELATSPRLALLLRWSLSPLTASHGLLCWWPFCSLILS